jgi:hypothetical protein
MTALSGTVTSSRRMALSWHEPAADVVPEVPSGVPGVVVVDPSGVDVSETSVDRAKPGFVGGRVDVTKRAGAEVGVSCETVIQEPRLRLVSRSKIQVFFMQKFYFEIIKSTVPKVSSENIVQPLKPSAGFADGP